MSWEHGVLARYPLPNKSRYYYFYGAPHGRMERMETETACRPEQGKASTEENAACGTCNHAINRKPFTGCTTLECGHVFHPRCIHNFIKGSDKCPRCPTTTNTPGLDFGDDVHVTNATRLVVYGRPPTETARGKNGTPKATVMQLLSKVALGFGVPESASFPSYCTPDELVNLRAPLGVFTARRITLRNIIESGVTLKVWLATGHSVHDLVKLGCKWDDLLFMGLTADDLSKTIPAALLVTYFGVNITHLLRLGVGLAHLAKYSPDELLSLQCTTHTLINMGLSTEGMRMFDFSQGDWDRLALVAT